MSIYTCFSFCFLFFSSIQLAVVMSNWKYGFTPCLDAIDLDTCDKDDVDDGDFNSIKKKLFRESSDGSEPKSSSKKETVQVFLRVKPRTSLDIQLKQAECFHFEDGGQELLAIAPRQSKSKTAASKNDKFTFTRIFGPDATQLELFEETLLPSLKDFLDGQNCLVFTYGITNSGELH